MPPPTPLEIGGADDDDDWREVLVLAARACHQGPVRQFADGESALAGLAASAPAAALWVVDVHMPRMPGVEVIARLRALQPRALVAAVSAAATEPEWQACLAAGAMAVLRKPTAFPDIVEGLRELVRLAEQRGAAPP